MRIAGRVRATVGLLLVGLLLVAAAPVPARAAQPDPRVVIVVGPVGGLTEAYRTWARAGAAEARRWTSDVVEIYSPDATWAQVRAALQGASVVVYLGHGNGFPSTYGTTIRPSVQDGFGLNPVAGRGDTTHQYFGEAVVAEQVRLAPGAVVLLFHLCYASGLAEPGVAEGTETVARARVDNFAAGFLAPARPRWWPTPSGARRPISAPSSARRGRSATRGTTRRPRTATCVPSRASGRRAPSR